ncbi:MAG: AAA family ATPase [Streptosporangiaceae bacterium]
MARLPGAGKTTWAQELAAEHGALRLSPDAWMIPLFGDSEAGGKREVPEGRPRGPSSVRSRSSDPGRRRYRCSTRRRPGHR